jgi:hypothetical protein
MKADELVDGPITHELCSAAARKEYAEDHRCPSSAKKVL